MLYLYISKNLLILFATRVHMHLFAPLVTCVLLKWNQTLKNPIFFAPKYSNTTFLPNFVNRLLTQVLEVANMKDSIRKLASVPTFSDFRLTLLDWFYKPGGLCFLSGDHRGLTGK